jgi:acyl-CoA reductase-like NAD-dependent aldehyde dehydrogenase
VLVDQNQYTGLLTALEAATRGLYGSDPAASADYGRIVNARHVSRLRGVMSSGRVVFGGQVDDSQRYVAPTVLADVSMDSAAMQEEIFGPILPVIPYEALDEALAKIRQLPPPLAVYLFTNSREVEQQVTQNTRSGGVCVNDTIVQAASSALPFGGVGESGMGVYHGQAGFETFSQRRSIMRRSLRFDARMRYPPPGLSLTWLKRVRGWLLNV